MISTGKKILIILLIFDVIIAALIAATPESGQALTGWLFLNLMIILPAALIRIALKRRRKTTTKANRGSSRYFEGAIYDSKSKTWKAPGRNSIYAQDVGYEDDSLDSKVPSGTIRSTIDSSSNLGSTSATEIAQEHKASPSDFDQLLAEGFSQIAQTSEFNLLKKESHLSDNKFHNDGGVYALTKGQKVLWTKSFERPITDGLSSEGFVGIIWEKVSSTHNDRSNGAISFLSVLDNNGRHVAEIDLPFPAYAVAVSSDLAVIATAFPENSIRCYDIKNSAMKWRLEGIVTQTITRLMIESDEIHVFDSLGNTILFSLDTEGRVMNDPGGIFVVNELRDRLSEALSDAADIRIGWNEKREFPVPMVSLMKLDGLPDQVDINVWSHSNEHKVMVTKVVSDALEALKDKIVVEGMEDITNEEEGVLDPVTWHVIDGSKPVFRKLIRVKILSPTHMRMT